MTTTERERVAAISAAGAVNATDEDLVTECKRRGFRVYAPERIKVVSFTRAMPCTEWERMSVQPRWPEYEKRHMAAGIADHMLGLGAFVFSAEPERYDVVLSLSGAVVLPKAKEDACSP